METMCRVSVACVLLSLFFITGCVTSGDIREVVIYTSVDLVYSEPVLDAFERETGIRVLPVYDVEASKTTGLVNRLIAEAGNPQCDVWWNGEFAQTITLKEEGVLAPYESGNAAGVPDQYRDSDDYWTGMPGRARVLIINTDLVEEGNYPDSIFDILDPSWPPEMLGIAQPLFGTTATQAAALYASLGADKGKQYFEEIQSLGVKVVNGNSVVRDMVVSGQLMFGLTDTDDACAAIDRGDPVDVVFPDQHDYQIGNLIIPGTVALVEGGPNPDEAGVLMDFLLSEGVEIMLIESGWSHVSLRGTVVENNCFDTTSIKGMDVSLEEIHAMMEQSSTELAEIFVR